MKMKISQLTDEQRKRMQECLQWLQIQPFKNDEEYHRVLKEAGEKWPDVKDWIGWSD